MNCDKAMLAFLVSLGVSLYLEKMWEMVIQMNVSNLCMNVESLVTGNLSVLGNYNEQTRQVKELLETDLLSSTKNH